LNPATAIICSDKSKIVLFIAKSRKVVVKILKTATLARRGVLLHCRFAVPLP
jgi:hypothetical protein